jgi:hypothetical protein
MPHGSAVIDIMKRFNRQLISALISGQPFGYRLADYSAPAARELAGSLIHPASEVTRQLHRDDTASDAILKSRSRPRQLRRNTAGAPCWPKAQAQ